MYFDWHHDDVNNFEQTLRFELIGAVPLEAQNP